MPQIPRFQRQVGDGILPTAPTASDQATPPPTGAGLAQEAGALSDQASNFAIAQVRRADQIRVKKAQTDYMRAMTDLDTEVRSKKLGDAIGATDFANAREQEIRAAHMEGLNDRQRQDFMAWALGESAKFDASTSLYESSETEKFDHATTEAFYAGINNNIKPELLDNPAAVELTLGEIRKASSEWADRNGLEGDMAEVEVQRRVDSFHNAAMDRLQNEGHDIILSNYFDRYKDDLSSGLRGQWSKQVGATSTNAEIQRAMTQMFAEGMPFDEMIDNAYNWQFPPGVDELEARRKLAHSINDRITLQAKASKQAENQQFIALSEMALDPRNQNKEPELWVNPDGSPIDINMVNDLSDFERNSIYVMANQIEGEQSNARSEMVLRSLYSELGSLDTRARALNNPQMRPDRLIGILTGPDLQEYTRTWNRLQQASLGGVSGPVAIGSSKVASQYTQIDKLAKLHAKSIGLDMSRKADEVRWAEGMKEIIDLASFKRDQLGRELNDQEIMEVIESAFTLKDPEDIDSQFAFEAANEEIARKVEEHGEELRVAALKALEDKRRKTQGSQGAPTSANILLAMEVILADQQKQAAQALAPSVEPVDPTFGVAEVSLEVSDEELNRIGPLLRQAQIDEETRLLHKQIDEDPVRNIFSFTPDREDVEGVRVAGQRAQQSKARMRTAGDIQLLPADTLRNIKALAKRSPESYYKVHGVWYRAWFLASPMREQLDDIWPEGKIPSFIRPDEANVTRYLTRYQDLSRQAPLGLPEVREVTQAIPGAPITFADEE